MEGTIFAGDTLTDDARILVDENSRRRVSGSELPALTDGRRNGRIWGLNLGRQGSDESAGLSRHC